MAKWYKTGEGAEYAGEEDARWVFLLQGSSAISTLGAHKVEKSQGERISPPTARQQGSFQED